MVTRSFNVCAIVQERPDGIKVFVEAYRQKERSFTFRFAFFILGLDLGLDVTFGEHQSELSLGLGREHPLRDHQHQRPGEDTGVHGVALGWNQRGHLVECDRFSVDGGNPVGTPAGGQHDGEGEDGYERRAASEAAPARGAACSRPRAAPGPVPWSARASTADH